MIELPEFSRKGWMRLGFILLSSCVAKVIGFFSFASTLTGEVNRFEPIFQFIGFVVGFAPLFGVLIWKGEFSFFDAVKYRGRIKGHRLWLVPLIPPLVCGIVSAIEYPAGYRLLFNQMQSLGFDFNFVVFGWMGVLTGLCLYPSVTKGLSDNSNWKWFIGLFILIWCAPDAVTLACSWFKRDAPELEKSILSRSYAIPMVVSVVSAGIGAIRLLLLMLWSRGDIRVAIALFFWTAVQMFVAPTRGSIAGFASNIVGLFLLWVVVGGVKQLQRSRSMVAQGDSAEV